MIARNEAHVLRRCLDSVLPLLDYILLVDTGSEDGTQSLVREYLNEKNIPGDVVDEPWQDFAYNRSFALQKLRENTDVDYSLMIDADQVIVFEPGFDAPGFKNRLSHDIYDVKLTCGNVAYLSPQLARNRVEISYRGVLHEFRECPPDCTRSIANGFHIQEIQDGARSRDIGKYKNDATTLEAALVTETDPFLVARYKFYLAQSYRDCGNAERAVQTYMERSKLGFWDEEVFLSLYYAAKLQESLGSAPNEIIEVYLRAHQACPRRAEALHGAARLCRNAGQYERGYLLAKQAIQIPCPERGLFVENWIYEYGILDELAVLAYWRGYYRESLDACVQMLEQSRIPDDQRERVRQNAHYALAKLGPVSGSEVPFRSATAAATATRAAASSPD